MNWINRLYALVLRLYPRPFRERFGDEMAGVFASAAREARDRRGLWSFLLRELVRLPASLAGEYVYAFRTQNTGGLAFSGASGGEVNVDSSGAGGAPAGWGAFLLAGLPHLLLGLLTGGQGLVYALAPEVGKIFDRLGWLPFAALVLICVVVLVYNLRAGWKSWSASWLLYIFFLPAFAIITQIANNASESGTLYMLWSVLQIVVAPLAVAYFLYKLACADPKRSLLAALPMTVVFWAFFQEFVPSLLRGLAYLWIFGLAFAAAGLILRTRRLSAALGLALAVPVLGGLPFAYLGVYHGGTLPFSEPGPSPRVVIEQYLPFLVMVSTMILGPQLGARLRALGRASSAEGGNAASRLALGGILLALALILVYTARSMNLGALFQILMRNPWLIRTAAALAALLYLAGIAWLVWALIRSGVLSGEQDAELRVPLLMILAPGVPLTFLVLVLNITSAGFEHSLPVQGTLVLWMLAAAWAAARPALPTEELPA